MRNTRKMIEAYNTTFISLIPKDIGGDAVGIA
jgi:hypothetical protein